ncbi:SPOR domain-containing protein [Defluviimonas sp. WL0002]|uniref:SPOR domain-containing protein n=1 Tax=Albidovulum marisflavi TaxID=2984159 RepID=A0ABT2ZBZ9_9RHOB|nr:SPOR domain-containing protein [Defluviimonas sp. WL0002]MCV2868629.1 SPOR domain-containing protein [Defluviimonas sp. WL0002]
MADIDFDDFPAERAYAPPRSEMMQKYIGIAGAVTSAALVAGLLVWGYKLAVRDVTGIPVIMALEGPARVAPENPGGELAEHTGLAVNAIAADGVAEPPAETLTLAPGTAGLATEDVAGGELASLPTVSPDVPQVTDQNDSAAPAPETGGEVVPAAAPANVPLADPLPDEAPEPLLDALEPQITGDTLAAARPVARPARLASVSASEGGGYDADADAIAAAVAEALAPVAVDVSPAALPVGTSLAQLGSFDTEAEARLEWDRIIARYGALMDGRQRVIEPAEAGGNSFVRLRAAGFEDIDDARRFCSVLLAESTQCVPTLTK